MASPLRLALVLFAAASTLHALDRPDVTFKVFQFPQDQIPRIDGDVSDWSIVPDDYAIKTDQLVDDGHRHPQPDPKNLDIKVRVGWVKGLSRLYFLYEAYDDFWDFADPGLHNDTFEIVVDGDASGGPLIPKDTNGGRFWNAERVGKTTAQPDDRISNAEANWAIHGVHAQNYHIMTPAAGKDWTMSWNAGTWVKEFPWANAKTNYSFKHGESGKLILEFYVTLFDYAGPEGPARAVQSVLRENKIIGASFAVIDYDAPKTPQGFWNLSRQHTMYGQASELCAFRLMPLEPRLLPALEAHWSFAVVDMDRRLVAFKDETIGKPVSWKWTFGDGETSTDQNPMHTFSKPGNYVTMLDVTDAGGKTSRRSKIWEVQLR